MASNGAGGGREMTLTVLGCGTLGTAILYGILESINNPGKASETSAEAPSSLPSRFISCVRTAVSAQRIKKALAGHLDGVKVVQNDNVKACVEADVVLLGCKPYMVNDVLTVEGMRAALKGKLVISICAGIPVTQMETALYSKGNDGDSCYFVRAMPNTASAIQESMTVIATSETPIDPETAKLVTWIFKQIGDVVYLPASNMDASTALCGSGPAFFLLMLEAAIDGGVAMGIPRAEAQRMAAQTMRGAASMVLAGSHPAMLREQVTTPGGCTMGGLLVLEEGCVRGTVSRAVREATVVASQLGNGLKNVNGTRH
ncbi:pyrroline carboxylate reductase [Calycina marina]|uniref:Pyrroline-5-carboxylate reductase n=1 Tax=Calycina marina TaxID=1763456 RepID=A0A9P7Z0S4_9HELO|nr:pyrroline carboxylate reductase [Calycina marina]